MALRQTIDAPATTESDELSGSAPYPSLFAAVMVRDEPAFSVVECNVIELARRDPLASLERPGVIERAIAWMVGARIGAKQLADPKLEALRRAAVVTHHRRHLPDPVAAELRMLGYGEGRIRALETMVLRA